LSISQQPALPNNSIEEVNALILDSIQDIKGLNIVKLDLRALEDRPTDFFFICEGESGTKVSAIASNIFARLKSEMGISPFHYEGKNNEKWVLLDYFDVVIHVFYPETRAYYELEDLWSDAKVTEYQNI